MMDQYCPKSVRVECVKYYRNFNNIMSIVKYFIIVNIVNFRWFEL